MLMRGSAEVVQKEQRTNPILQFTSVLNYFHEKVVFFVMSWCTSGVGLQVLPFIDKRHLGSNFLQRFPCIE